MEDDKDRCHGQDYMEKWTEPGWRNVRLASDGKRHVKRMIMMLSEQYDVKLDVN